MILIILTAKNMMSLFKEGFPLLKIDVFEFKKPNIIKKSVDEWQFLKL